jgi:hypothetical protein
LESCERRRVANKAPKPRSRPAVARLTIASELSTGALCGRLDFYGHALAENGDIPRILGGVIFLGWFVHLPPVFPKDLF